MNKKIFLLFPLILLSACDSNTSNSKKSDYSSDSLSNSNQSVSHISSSSNSSSTIFSSSTPSSSTTPDIEYPWLSSSVSFSDENESHLKLVIDSQKVYATDLTNTFDTFKNVEADYTLINDQFTFSCEFYDLIFDENVTLNFNFTIQENENSFTFILNEDVVDSYDFCVYDAGLILKQF